MNKIILLISLLIVMLTLPACGTNEPAPEQAATAQAATMIAEIVSQAPPPSMPTETSPTVPTAEPAATIAEPVQHVLNTNYPEAVSIQVQLLIGTLRLDTTNIAVTREQATVLLPLWNNFLALKQSGPITQEQVEPLMQQIQVSMTPEQITTIATMQITQQDLRAMFQELGLTPAGKGNQGAARGQGNEVDRIPPELVNTLIQLLQTKTN